MSNVFAIVDAAIVYGAERYLSGVHDDRSWPYRDQYSKSDDEELFLEFLHYLSIFDEIVVDNSSLSEGISNEIRSLIDRIKYFSGTFNGPLFCRQVAPDLSGDTPDRVRNQFCVYLANLVAADTAAMNRIAAVEVPWAYHQPRHHDWPAVAESCKNLRLPECLIPFTVFAWRGIMYGGFAHHARMAEKSLVSYVAAPGRMAALKAVLPSKDLERFERPRKAWRELVSEMPSLPEFGYDFSFLESLPVVYTSRFSQRLLTLTPQDALSYVCKYRNEESSKELRKDWAEVIFSATESNLVGSQSIQIMRNNKTIFGNVIQKIIANPRN